jgi:mannose-6-phosphate isomerase-like protein (cupin superfamily)
MHDHTNEDEVFIIQKGRGTVIDDGKEYDIEAGDVMLTGKGASHSITNNGKDDLVITAIIMQY